MVVDCIKNAVSVNKVHTNQLVVVDFVLFMLVQLFWFRVPSNFFLVVPILVNS